MNALQTAVAYYQARALSAGQAAEMAGVSKLAFLQKLGDFGIFAFDQTKEELEREFAAAGAVQS